MFCPSRDQRHPLPILTYIPNASCVLHLSITLLVIRPLLINMKFASFFVALLLGALSDSAAADAAVNVDGAVILVLSAPAPKHDSCEHYGSAYTGKSGKVMSMSKSGKGLRNSKSSKANSSGTGTGTLKVGYSAENGTEYWLTINNVQPEHCLGEIHALVEQWGFNTFGGVALEPEFYKSQVTNVVPLDISVYEHVSGTGLVVGANGGWETELWVNEHEQVAIQDHDNEPVRS